jgi:hypothetical protein
METRGMGKRERAGDKGKGMDDKLMGMFKVAAIGLSSL